MRKLLFAALMLLCAATADAQYRKSVSILGDSYSTFENYLTPDTNEVWYFDRRQDCTDVTQVEETWWYQFITNQGLRLERNNSFSGATISATGYDKADYSSRAFFNRMWNLGSPDIILIFGATNDSWAHSPIGEFKYSGWTKDDLYSFRPAMAYLLRHIKARYPNVEIYFIMNCDLSEEITSSCATICSHYGIEMISLQGIDKLNGHPSIKGMRQIAEQLGEAIGK